MALKGARNLGNEQDITWFCDDTPPSSASKIAVERGVVMIMGTGAAHGASGVARDSGRKVAEANTVADASGRVAVGLLVGDVVQRDLTSEEYNLHKTEFQTGGKVTLAKYGTFHTDMISGTTPTAGDPARVGPYGYFTADVDGIAGVGPVVGQFKTAPDENGFAEVSIDIL